MNHAPCRSLTSAIAAAAFGLLSLSSTGIAFGKVANAPKDGDACTKLGAHAKGTALDCVASDGAMKWRTKGTRPNPYLFGETAVIRSRHGQPIWRLTVNSANRDAAADFTRDPKKRGKIMPPGSKFVTANVDLSFLQGLSHTLPASAWWDIVDPSDTNYTLYAFRGGEIDCKSFGTIANALDMTQGKGPPISGNLCAVLPEAAAQQELLLRVQAKFNNKREPYTTWFRLY